MQTDGISESQKRLVDEFEQRSNSSLPLWSSYTLHNVVVVILAVLGDEDFP